MEDIKALIALGLVLLLILLRLQAEEFGAAEYDEVVDGEKPPFRRRLAWYLIGIAVIVAVYNIHPTPRDTLNLVTGRRIDALVFGTGFAVLGVAQAILFALWRYGDLRLPAGRAYPDAAINTVATAFIDEVTFRGILLGMMIAVGVNETIAVAVQAIVYALATRLGAKGRHPYALLVILAIGFAGGWVTIWTGGIGASFFGNTVTRFALFVATGHAGRVLRRGEEPEDSPVFGAPSGWRDARTAPSRRGAEPRDLVADVAPVSALPAMAPGLAATAHAGVGGSPGVSSAAVGGGSPASGVGGSAAAGVGGSPASGIEPPAAGYEVESSVNGEGSNVRRTRGAHPRGEASRD